MSKFACGVINLFRILNLGWVSVKADAHWGVNRATRAIENNIDVEAVILFKGNVCNNMIWHIPAACRLKGVPFVSIEKKVTLPHTIPVKNISVLAIKKTNVRMGCLSEAVRYNYDDMTVKYAAY
ncbi:hypothetical protein, conserved [Babesia bigemina]|uniref:Ribosomal protein L7Ae/L30e/S12e/Gadd45 domain-containing protein n=1 Tax=Babesia bigemina TaxID=5866 RepID=A0A061D910_BABBI|nr:hypothetical protein, conserved [Babesia bigemina]CDR95374.1 hypothetical protein, conserved [Babesia bigemina]|eukprot:XP_012767560.1 hypothetical protein, conserved [Babesia bigemina]